jgi:KaiC/GvpD/RAD55 family RecA-like ATPase/predicted flap endonuclease-1-like 5' DNA nuclease
MPKDDEAPEKNVTCPICGYESPPGSERCDHCYNSLADEDEPAEQPQAPDKETGELLKIPGVGEAKAEVLKEAGYHSIRDIQTASVEELSAVKGIGEKLASKIIQGANDLSNPSNAPLASWLQGEDDGLSTWLSGEDSPQPQSEAVDKEIPPSDSLARWLSGEEDDVNVWLSETKEVERRGGTERIGPHETLAREAELIQLRETLREKLREFESGEFDPQKTVEELARAKGELESERNRVRQLFDELENVKRGSIAVIKFIKSQQGTEADQSTLADKLASEMANRETLELRIMQLEEVLSTLKSRLEEGISDKPLDAQELSRREVDLREKEAQLEAMKRQLLSKEEALSAGMFTAGAPTMADLGRAPVPDFSQKEQEYTLQIQDLQARLAQTEFAVKQKDEMLQIASGDQGKGVVDKEILAKLEEAQRAERTLVVREQEVHRLRDDLKIRDEELRRLKEPMKYKEEEMLRREEDLMFRERLLQEEQKKVALTKSELGAGGDELTLKKRLEELKAEVNAKEEEIRSKEKFISLKEEELRMREQGVISEEIEKREQDRMLELKQEKVKTGTARLDDLLMGGMPFGANVLVYGPPFTGKEVLLNTFIAEGLKKGVPAIWIITEKSPKEIREEMTFVVSGYEEYEKLGLVRYVDAYSRSMGDESQDPYTDYIESPTDYESIQKAIETVSKQFMEKHEYYRVGFRSISTLIAYLDPGTAFRFLSPVVGRRKRDRAVAMYTIEKGVHGEQEIQMIGSLMDGMIEFKVENLNTFLAIRGICDVQSRAFIRYTATKVGVTIGSFSLDHIR